MTKLVTALALALIALPVAIWFAANVIHGAPVMACFAVAVGVFVAGAIALDLRSSK